MKLAILLENQVESRTELLHLQQKLIDALPDEIDVNMIDHQTLGPCLELIVNSRLGPRLLRMVRPNKDANLIDVASHQN